MTILIDSSNLSEIEDFYRMGVIRGVTTNPSIMLKDQACSSLEDLRTLVCRITELVAPYPVSVEVFINEKEKMLEQARNFSSWAENIVIKIPVHGPDGELHNLETIHELEKVHNIRVNATAIMSPHQCLLAALAGATYVSLFAGRVNNMGYDSCAELKKTRALLDTCNLPAKIIAASIREIINVSEWLLAGAHFVTVPPKILRTMVVHPYTKETVRQFLDDAGKLMKNQ